MLAHGKVQRKHFGRAGNLKMLTDNKEKIHICALCQKTFGRPGVLKKHILTHSEEKPHKCIQCDYATSQAGTLRRHIKTHSLQKPIWQINANGATTLQVQNQILTNICSPTVEKSHIIVKCVGDHSAKQDH